MRLNIVHLVVLERRLHGSPAGLVARYTVDPDPRKFSEGVKLFQHVVVLQRVACSIVGQVKGRAAC